MDRHAGKWIAGVVVALALTAGSRQVAAQSEVPVTVFLQTKSPAQRLDRCVIDAQHEVTRIYKRIGVSVLWIDAAQVLTARVIVTIVSDEAAFEKPLGLKAAPASSLGMALPSEHRLAYVFYERIVRISEMRGAAVTSILAVAMAHEIGHLLLPDRTHTTTGLMRGDWDEQDFRKAVCGLLQFTDDQAELIRAGLLAGQD